VRTPVDVDPDAIPESAGEGLDDVTLVMRARDGDMAAYEQLVRRYQGPMYRLAAGMLSSKADAEDVVQEVFLTAWRRLGQLQQDAATSTSRAARIAAPRGRACGCCGR